MGLGTLKSAGSSPLPRIFVVDDEKNIAWSVALILNKYGFDATAFYNPEDLLDCSETREPDLVISDIVMPQMNGIDLANLLRTSYPRCKILLCSGQASALQLLDLARRSGHEFEVFPKPFSPRSLLSHVRRLLTDEDWVKDADPSCVPPGTRCPQCI